MKLIRTIRVKCLPLILLVVFNMLSSCVQGDLYDLYDEDLSNNQIIPRSKNIFDNHVKLFWQENECGLWALMNLNHSIADNKDNRLYHMTALAHTLNSNITWSSPTQIICETYYAQVYAGGFKNNHITPACNYLSINVSHYYNQHGFSSEFWSSIGDETESHQNFQLTKTVVVQITGKHYCILDTIYNNKFYCTDHDNTTPYPVDLSTVGSCYVRN